MSEVGHRLVVKRQCVKSMVTGEDSSSGQMVHMRSLTETKVVRRTLPEITRNNIGSVSDEKNVAGD